MIELFCLIKNHRFIQNNIRSRRRGLVFISRSNIWFAHRRLAELCRTPGAVQPGWMSWPRGDSAPCDSFQGQNNNHFSSPNFPECLGKGIYAPHIFIITTSRTDLLKSSCSGPWWTGSVTWRRTMAWTKWVHLRVKGNNRPMELSAPPLEMIGAAADQSSVWQMTPLMWTIVFSMHCRVLHNTAPTEVLILQFILPRNIFDFFFSPKTKVQCTTPSHELIILS